MQTAVGLLQNRGKNILEALVALKVVRAIDNNDAYPQAVGAEAVHKVANLTADAWSNVLDASNPGQTVVTLCKPDGSTHKARVKFEVRPNSKQFWDCQYGRLLVTSMENKNLPQPLLPNSHFSEQDDACGRGNNDARTVSELYELFKGMESSKLIRISRQTRG